MARGMPENPSQKGVAEASTSACILEEPECLMRKWYFTRQEIEDHTPSRRDGISLKKESQLRDLYCSFIKEIGQTLEMSQMIIACGMMLCHRFYMRQSHAKNDWQAIATSSFFLAGKIQDIPRRKSDHGIQYSFLRDVVVVSYEMQHKLDSSASQSIRKTEVFNKQKELILVGERLILSTIGFDLDIQLPYTSLVPALKSLNVIAELGQSALNFVNDCLCTSLCLQYKPQYIAAASVALAAEIKKVKLPIQQGKVWWLEFDVSLKQLNEVIRRMIRPDRKQASPPKNMRAIESETSSRKPSVTDVNVGSESKLIKGELDDSKSRCKIRAVDNSCKKIDIDRIRELKRRKCEKVVSKKLVHSGADELDTEAWIESELENGLELGDTSANKKQRT